MSYEVKREVCYRLLSGMCHLGNTQIARAQNDFQAQLADIFILDH